MIILANAEQKICSRWQSGLNDQSHVLCVDALTRLRKILDRQADPTVLLHRSLPGIGRLAEITELVKRYPQARLFVLADLPEEQEGIELIRAGVLGYVNTHIKPEILNEAVKVIELGEIWASKRLLQWMVNHCGSPEQHQAKLGSYLALDTLTASEKKVMGQLLEGAANKQIAKKLQITERTVKAHLTSIYKKTGVKDRLHLALLVNSNNTQ